MKHFTLFVCTIIAFSFTKTEGYKYPVKWDFSIEKIDESTAYFVIKGDIEDGWRVFGKYPYLESTKIRKKDDDIPTIHVGSQEYTDSSECTNLGPICLNVNYTDGGNLILETIHSTKLSISKYSKIFEGNITYYENEIELRQKIKYIPKQRLKGDVYFMACNHEKCHAPIYIDFDITIAE